MVIIERFPFALKLTGQMVVQLPCKNNMYSKLALSYVFSYISDWVGDLDLSETNGSYRCVCQSFSARVSTHIRSRTTEFVNLQHPIGNNPSSNQTCHLPEANYPFS